ncbi:methylmalonyl Co-A mutase-associated GTPase MeaB [Lacihabitans sp. CCS-44]|uniref:methylmalonyl Co-A mutase-associated GTPase MeaB n=1 Tax=Lacihabitans sp. CCS-44 TaxID=2487331 RepID=UPI0020CD6266|nr:methylmalonyl Co-A mutase-associated GTPase MeaB [Lacihabitans sp. CCS-44]MCP9755912.1 methylmalonyl Co-A mutase-associated GTPase MeaB [Lacihabitans sp. CCS-44]
MLKNRLSTQELKDGVLASDKAVLGRAITLVESQSVKDRPNALSLVNEILPYSGNSFRMGITGAPGVGKSTFIDGFGDFLLSQGKKVAILAIDPSSKVSGGSILGDKTRMEKLVGKKDVFIRPSPAGFELGGVAQSTLESILLCEAAGYDFIIVETVGVGQSETAVKEMTDMLMFLTIAGAGDYLQGIKRGIMEMIDLVVINKSDQIDSQVLSKLIGNFNHALHLFPAREFRPTVEILNCSALNSVGFDQIWDFVIKYETHVKENGSFAENRNLQNLNWMSRSLLNMIQNHLQKNELLKSNIEKFESLVTSKSLSPLDAAKQIFDLLNLG